MLFEVDCACRFTSIMNEIDDIDRILFCWLWVRKSIKYLIEYFMKLQSKNNNKNFKVFRERLSSGYNISSFCQYRFSWLENQTQQKDLCTIQHSIKPNIMSVVIFTIYLLEIRDYIMKSFIIGLPDEDFYRMISVGKLNVIIFFPWISQTCWTFNFSLQFNNFSLHQMKKLLSLSGNPIWRQSIILIIVLKTVLIVHAWL